MKKTFGLDILGAVDAMTNIDYLKETYSNVRVSYQNSDDSITEDVVDIEIYNLDELKFLRKDLIVWMGNTLGAFDAMTKPLREGSQLDANELAEVLSSSQMAVYNSEFMKADINKVHLQLVYELWYREVRLYAHCLTTHNENKELSDDSRKIYLEQAHNILESIARQMITFGITQFYSSVKSDNPDYTRRHLDILTSVTVDKFLFEMDIVNRRT